jgi:hypothetical protein
MIYRYSVYKKIPNGLLNNPFGEFIDKPLMRHYQPIRFCSQSGVVVAMTRKSPRWAVLERTAHLGR